MSTPQRIQQRRTKRSHDPRPTSVDRPCYRCGKRAGRGQNGYCGPDCRFWAKVTRTDGCWHWNGAKNSPKGYGRFDANGVRYVAHRYAYERTVGPIPDGLQLDHLCKNRMCVNPAHVEAITEREHGRRSGIDSGKARRNRA